MSQSNAGAIANDSMDRGVRATAFSGII